VEIMIEEKTGGEEEQELTIREAQKCKEEET
jgi:hypothetical protein